MKGELSVNWDEPAFRQLRAIFEYIQQDSIKNAEKVVKEISAIAESLSNHPERYPLDKNKDNNDGSYRAFEKYKYRIAYRVLPTEVRILRVRSGRQEPLCF